MNEEMTMERTEEQKNEVMIGENNYVSSTTSESNSGAKTGLVVIGSIIVGGIALCVKKYKDHKDPLKRAERLRKKAEKEGYVIIPLEPEVDEVEAEVVDGSDVDDVVTEEEETK